MSTKATTKERVAVKGVGWKKPMSITTEKYDQVSRVILAVLTTEPIKFTELARLVGKQLPNFEGSVSWYTVSVARELETQGKIVRGERPVLYSKPGRPRTTTPSARHAQTEAARSSRRAKSST